MELKFDEKKVVGTATITKDITEKDVEGIMVTAIEGGIGYWACLYNVGEDFDNKPKDEPTSTWCAKLLIDGKAIKFTDSEGEDEEVWVLTLAKLIKGYELNMINRPHDADIENGDATTSDCIVQYALFGDVVYG
jgi:hypothetical protein